jgi:hypothetical protein
MRLKGLPEARQVADDLGVTLDIGGRDRWTLSRIVVPKEQRGTGVGAKVMEAVVREADKDGVVVALTPSTDFGATSKARLVAFYKRFGFVENKGRNKDFAISDTMYRLPQERLAGLPPKGRIPLATAKRAMAKLPPKVRACGFTVAQLREGMEVEREHRDVTKGAALKTARIAAAHLCEFPQGGYYPGLKRLERKLKGRR